MIQGLALGHVATPTTVSIYGQIRLVTATSLLPAAVLGVRDSLQGLRPCGGQLQGSQWKDQTHELGRGRDMPNNGEGHCLTAQNHFKFSHDLLSVDTEH